MVIRIGGCIVRPSWVGPVNPSGRRRREWPLHRTMTLGVSFVCFDDDYWSKGVRFDVFTSILISC